MSSPSSSSVLARRAKAAIPGGVNSPVRAFTSVGGEPIFAKRAEGARLLTEDDRWLIDFCMIQSAIPSMERIRLVSSGTEACMTAIRVARGATGRNKILKFSGCYHGHADCLLVKAGSGVAGVASASSAGVPESCASQTLVARYNCLEDVRSAIDAGGEDLAAVIIEPVAANMGLVFPDEGFLRAVSDLAHGCGALVIFDEVISGFRLVFGGYQNLCGVTPDLTTLGKAIGGGMPIGAVGGRADLMERLAPLGPVYQAGTLSGNPVSVAAGKATLQWLKENNPYGDLDARTATFVSAVEASARETGIDVLLPRLGSMFSLFFGAYPVRHFDDVMATDTARFCPLFNALLDHGVYLPPSAFETSFLSVAHTDDVLDEAATAFRRAFQTLAVS